MPALPRLQYAPLSCEPCDLPSALLDPGFGDDVPQREAKRRRIESLAHRYLKGFAPVIHSAALRGPFSPGWNNPWYPSSRPFAQQRSQGVTDHNARHASSEQQSRRYRRNQSEERAAQLQGDGMGMTPARPVDLAAEDEGGETTANNPKDRGDMPVQSPSTYTHEWLRRLGPSGGAPDPSPGDVPSFQESLADIKHLTPSKSTQPRSGGKGGSERDKPDMRPLSAGCGSARRARAVPDAASKGKVASDPVTAINSGKSVRKLSKNIRSDLPVRETFRFRAQGSLSQPATAESASVHEHLLELNGPQESSSARQPDADHLPPSLGVNFNEDSILEPASHGEEGRQRVVRLSHILPDKKTPDKGGVRSRQKHHSGFTPINQQFSSPKRSPQRAVSAPQTQRPALEIKAISDDPTLEEPVRSPLQGGVGMITMSAGKVHIRKRSLGPLNKSFEGQENTTVSISEGTKGTKAMNSCDLLRPPLREALQRSAEGCVTSGKTIRSTTKKKLTKRTHPMNASPAIGSSPGFAYRKVSDPIQNASNLLPVRKSDNRSVVKKRKGRLVSFGSTLDQQAQATNPGAPTGDELLKADAPAMNTSGPAPNQSHDQEEHPGVSDHEEQECRDQPGPTRDLSTQVAVLLAQEAFQHELVSPAKGAPGSQQSQHTTPPPSQPPVELTAITPFKDFNKGKLSLNGKQPSLAPPASTQELLDAASPFAFSTVKKVMKRKRVSIAASPSKLANVVGAEEVLTARTGIKGETTLADTTMATSAGPIFSTSPKQHKISSGLKSLSRDPALTPSLAITASMNETTEATPPASPLPVLTAVSCPAAPTPSASIYTLPHASVSRSQAGARQIWQEESTFQAGQRQQFMDDIELDAAIDEADSFLESWNLSNDLKRVSTGGVKATA